MPLCWKEDGAEEGGIAIPTLNQFMTSSCGLVTTGPSLLCHSIIAPQMLGPSPFSHFFSAYLLPIKEHNFK